MLRNEFVIVSLALLLLAAYFASKEECAYVTVPDHITNTSDPDLDGNK